MEVLDALATTRAIRRYTDDPVPPDALGQMLFAATRAPSGSNRQPFRFMVLTDSPVAAEAKRLIGEGARQLWSAKRSGDGYDRGSGSDPDSPKARMAASMEHYVEHFAEVPVLVLACIQRYRDQRDQGVYLGASVYPACQNLLIAARALGYGGVLTIWHAVRVDELRTLLGIPDDVDIAATITLGRPAGRHGPVRRRPMRELVFTDRWGTAPEWAVDPEGTQFTAAGPPRTTESVSRQPEAN